jgi:hypothetical protein
MAQQRLGVTTLTHPAARTSEVQMHLRLHHDQRYVGQAPLRLREVGQPRESPQRDARHPSGLRQPRQYATGTRAESVGLQGSPSKARLSKQICGWWWRVSFATTT